MINTALMPKNDQESQAVHSQEETTLEREPASKKLRLHYLDWMRLLLVICVVYGHTAKSGLTGGGGFNEDWLVDDRTLFDHRTYSDLYQNDTDVVNGWPRPISGPSPLAVRWISIVRQWCLPLLFWVSGASTACAYKGGMPRGIDKLLIFSAIGMSLNAALWFLGPLDDQCYIDNPSCVNKGLIFSFTIVPWAGAVFAVVFQMWYTVVLVLLLLLNWPLFVVTHRAGRKPWIISIQWLSTLALYATMVLGSGDACPMPTLVLSALAILELVFLMIAAVCSPGSSARPKWLPVRTAHYFLACVSVLQFGAVPYAEKMDTIGLSYISFILTGFNRFFGLGFLMTRARNGPEGDEAKPALSRAWPCMLLLGTVFAPSTNWDLAGMLTYPFFRHATDRCLYVGGALVISFIVDRCSRGVACDPLPRTLAHMGLLLYLFHPVLISLFLSLGLRSVPLVWLCSVVSSTTMVWVMCSMRRKVAKGRAKRRSSREEVHDSTTDTSSEGEGIL